MNFELLPLTRGLKGGSGQFYIFWDYGHLGAAAAFPSAVNSVSASSVGTGFRYSLQSNVTGHIDYGRALIQLPYANSGARNSFMNLALTVAY